MTRLILLIRTDAAYLGCRLHVLEEHGARSTAMASSCFHIKRAAVHTTMAVAAPLGLIYPRTGSCSRAGPARHLCSLCLMVLPCKPFDCSAYTASIIACPPHGPWVTDVTPPRTGPLPQMTAATVLQTCSSGTTNAMPQQARWAAQMTPTSQFKTVPAWTLAVWHC
jgi:hypothetical protein